VKEIPLKSKKYPGMVALVDDEDYGRLTGYQWRPAKCTNNNICGLVRFYAASSMRVNGVKKLVMMHAFLLGYVGADHHDGNGLNNQRYNLRRATRSQNAANSRKTSVPRSSRFKGVWWCKQHKAWRAQVTVSGVRKHLGLFASEVDAARAYNAASLHHFGKFARPNEVPDGL
jgi:hypothetical protein